MASCLRGWMRGTTVPGVSSFVDFQNEIYLGGLNGAMPELPLTATGLEDRARAVLSKEAFAYVAGSASGERTAAANRSAFDRHRIVPRMLRGTSGPGARDLSVEVLGTRLAAPVLTAPVGVLELLHQGGEVIVAEVTKELGVGTVLSTAASSTIEEVGAGAGSWWYQLYWPADDELARSFVERAERAGASAIVVTVDTPSLGWRPRDLELAHLPFLHGKGIANYLSDPVFRAKLSTPPEESEDAMRAAILTWSGLFGNHALRPADLVHLREWTDLPIAVKASCIRTTPVKWSTRVPTQWSSVITAAARSTVPSPHSTPYPPWPPASATARTSCSTPASAPARTCSLRWHSARRRCSSVAHGRTVSASRAEQVFATRCAFCSRTSTPLWACPDARTQPSSTVH